MPTFDINNLGPFERWLKTELKNSVRRGTVSAAFKGLQLITTKLIPKAMPHPPVDKGIYRAGWRVNTSATDGPVEIVNNVPHALFIEYGVRAANVKIGRKMIQALAEWAKRHQRGAAKPSSDKPSTPKVSPPKNSKPEKNSSLGAALMKLVKNLADFLKRNRVDAKTETKTGKDGGKKTTVKPLSDRAALSAAWAIALAMKERGIFNGTGLRIAEKATKEMVSIVEKEVAKQINRDFG